MSKNIAVKIPDIGNFKDIPVIEILVKVGERVSAEQSLITLETDKATMDVPAPAAGVVKELKLKVGDMVSEGSVILMLEATEDRGLKIEESATPASAIAISSRAPTTAPPASTQSSIPAPRSSIKGDIHAEVVVLGAGPGGYTAAFRAAALLRTGAKLRHARINTASLVYPRVTSRQSNPPAAPVNPRSGAPRTRSSRIASQMAATVLSRRYRSSPGSSVWSSNSMAPGGSRRITTVSSPIGRVYEMAELVVGAALHGKLQGFEIPAHPAACATVHPGKHILHMLLKALTDFEHEGRALLGQLQPHRPAIVEVALPREEPGALQPVQDTCHGL